MQIARREERASGVMFVTRSVEASCACHRLASDGAGGPLLLLLQRGHNHDTRLLPLLGYRQCSADAR